MQQGFLYLGSRSADRAQRAVTAVITVMLLLALMGGAGAVRVLAAPGQVEAGPVSRGIAPPEVTAHAVYAYDLNSGVVLYEKNANEEMQIGSTVKIATALVVVQHADLDAEVTIVEDDLVDASNSRMNLQAGDTLRVSQLLYGLLIPSGNDAANALARHVGMQLIDTDNRNDAVNAFVNEMNAYVEELGLEHTRFANPSGLDSDNSYSTAHDIAILGGELMRNETLANIVNEPAYALTSVGPEERRYADDSTNQLVGSDGVVGIKTGSTSDAGGCVVLARQMNDGNNMVITSVLGSDLSYDEEGMIAEDVRWEDARSILEDMDGAFTWAAPNADGMFPGLEEELAVWQAQMQDPPVIPIPTGDDAEAAYQLELGPAMEPGEQVGLVHLYYGEARAGSIPVYQAGDQAQSDDRLAGAG